MAATIASIPARTRPANDSADSPPGMMSQRSSSKARFTIGSPLASRMRYSPPSQSPSRTSARSSITVHSRPFAWASGAAVIAVRCSGVTNTRAMFSLARRAQTAAACASP